MQLRYCYRLDPRPRHRIAFGKAFGCARFVVNDALAFREAAYEAGLPHVTDAELSARLTAAKKAPERAWLNEVSSVVLQQALARRRRTTAGLWPARWYQVITRDWVNRAKGTVRSTAARVRLRASPAPVMVLASLKATSMV